MAKRSGSAPFEINYRLGYADLRTWNRLIRIYTNSAFHGISTLPNENTLEVNVTSDQLSSLSTVFRKQTAIAPTRVAEGGDSKTGTPWGKGYDIKLESAKELVFQHKAPRKARVRGPGDDDIQWLYYKVNMEQIYTLIRQYAPGEAFLALPAVPQQAHLTEALKRTVFVDVYAVFLHTLKNRRKTRYILVEYQPGASSTPLVSAKYATNKYAMKGLDTHPYYQLSDRTQKGMMGVYSWKDLRSKIQQCDYGLPIRGIREESLFDTIDLEPSAYSRIDLDLPEEYDTMEEFLSAFDPDYRDYLQRRFTISAYNRAAMDDTRNTYERQLLKSIRERVALGSEWGRISIPDEVRFHIEGQMGPESEWVLSKVIQPSDTLTNPLTKGLSRNCRYILEDGEESPSMTI